MRDSLSFAVACRIAANLCGVAAAFLSLRLYNLYLTKETYGTVAVAMQFLTYLPLAGGGFGMVLGQQMLSEKNEDALVSMARFSQVLQSYLLLLSLLIGFVLMAFYIQLPPARSTGVSSLLFFAIGFAGALSFYAGGQMGALVALGQQVYTIILTGLWSLLGLLILWGAFALGWKAWAIPTSTALGPLLLLPVAWWLLRRRVEKIPLLTWHRESDFWPRLRGLWSSALAWFQSQISIMLQFTLDIILMGVLFGPGAAAVYVVISRITGLSRQLIQSLCDTVWPKLTQESDPQRKADLMRKVDRLNAWVAGSWYGAMAATLHPFLGWWMKTDWVATPLLIGLVLARNLIISLSAPHSYGLLSLGRFKDLARITQREVLVSVVGIFLFAHFFGMIGVALGALFGTGGGSLFLMTRLYFSRRPQQHWFREWCAIYTRGLMAGLLSFATASAVWWQEQLHVETAGWMAMIAGGVGLAVGMAVAFAFALSHRDPISTRTGGFKIPTSW